MSSLATVPIENIRASVLSYLATSALIAAVPLQRWAFDGNDDVPTQSLADWLEPTVLAITGRPSRGSSEADVHVQVNIAVRRGGGDIHRREQIAAAIVKALANKRIDVGDHAGGLPATVVGVLRVMDPQYTNGGIVDGIHRGAVTADAYFTPPL